MNEDEKPQFLKKAGRYASLSGSATGLAVKLAGEKFLGIKIDKDMHSDQLKQVLGNLKGPIMKVGQILATIPDALPPEYADAFQELQSNAPPMGWPFVRRRMKAELGADWQSYFTDFPRDATAAASLGQVHKSVTTDGQTVACKLQYPDMSSAIDADLNQLKLLFKLYKQYDSSIITDDIHAELGDRLREELDYKREARVQKLFAHLLRDEPDVHVPNVIDDLSTDRLLVTEWLDGKKVLTFKDAPIEQCVRVFRPEFVGAVIDLYKALKSNDQELAISAYKTWGFGDLNKDMIEVLNIWASFLYGPILDDKVRTIGETNNGVYGREKAQEVHAKLREMRQGVPVPREFVFMDRAALGLGSVFIHLQAEVNWYQLFNEMIKGFETEKLRRAQNSILPEYDLA